MANKKKDKFKYLIFLLLGFLGIGATYLALPGLNIKTPDYYIECNTPIFPTQCNIFMAEKITDSKNYAQLNQFLSNSYAFTTVNMHLKGYGGSTDGLNYIINSIKTSAVTLNTIIEGPVYSNHAYLAMIGKHIKISPLSFFMFHKADAVNDQVTGDPVDPIISCISSIGHKDRGQDAFLKCIQQVDAMEWTLQKYIRICIKKYLTKNELQLIKDGFDVYINSDDMKQRISK